jgi:hypothetical protein
MKNFNRKKMLLIGAAIFLMTFYFLTPTVSGYGSSFGSATTIGTGITNDTLLSTDTDAYYKISVPEGEDFGVGITYDTNSFDLGLYLYNPSLVEVASDTTGGSVPVVVEVGATGGYYYVRVNRITGTGDANIIIVVIFMSKYRVPGFDTMLVIYGLLVLLGIALSLKYQKSLIR